MATRRPPPAIEGLHSLKVDNISYNTSQAELRRIFDKYGEVGDVHIPRDKYTRQSKGFAFVRYYSRSDAEYAQERTDGRWVDGRELRVAVARYERPANDRERGDARRRSRSPRRRASPRYSRSRSPRNRSRSRSPRDKRSRSPRDRSRSRSRSSDVKDTRKASVSRSPSPRRSTSPKRSAKSRSPSPKRSPSKSCSPKRDRSGSP